jgi:3'-phosphoadenosine 5'-phosphosulfate sulfotransferase (PAPS reductase)/FAD synthetase
MLLLGELFDKTYTTVDVLFLTMILSEFRMAIMSRNKNDRGGLAKCNPIAYWTLEDTFDYIAKYKVPHHPLHAKGYPSIG